MSSSSGPQPKPPSSATAASSPPADSALLNDGALPGEQTDVTGIIEHVDAAGNFAVFRGGERIGAGCHVDFTLDPDGFTNVPEAPDRHEQTARELAIYRFSGDVLEVCKASEHGGRPTSFGSPRGSGWTHVAIRRISDRPK